MSRCGARIEDDDNLHILYLDTAAVADIDYDTTHIAWIAEREQAIIIPNTVLFLDALPDRAKGKTFSYSGSANDSDSVTAIGTFTAIQVDESIISNADAAARATSWIAKKVAEAKQGYYTAPMHCGQEIYDMVQVVEPWGAVTAKGRCGLIERIYDSEAEREEQYSIKFTLGGLVSEVGEMPGFPGVEGMDDDLRDLTDRVDPVKHDLPSQVNAWEIQPALLPAAIDIDFVVTDDDDISWSAGGTGVITFADGSTLSINAGNLNLANANPYYIYATIGSATLSNTQSFGGAIGADKVLVAFVKKGATTDQKALVVVGTTGPDLFIDELSAITANMGVLTAGEIHVGTGTWGASWTGFGLDSSYIAGYNSGVLQAYISSTDGKFYAGTGKVILDDTGVYIDNTPGIPWGQMRFHIDSPSTTVSLYLDTDTYLTTGTGLKSAGLFSAGGGPFDIGKSGTKWNILYATTLGASGTYITTGYITTIYTANLYPTGSAIGLYGDIWPIATNTHDLGSSTYRFADIWGQNLYLTNLIANYVAPQGGDSTGAIGLTGTRWADVWADLYNGADYSMANGWRILESELYHGYPVGFAIGYNELWEEGKSIWKHPEKIGNIKPIFAVTNDFIEYHGYRITPEILNKLLKLLGG